ncbi:MAG: GSCFA domain-containing protein [Tidjanibacter sp.]|nr:GSCFA domain-containing protein [Tidjanibacter sp.]
MKLRTEITIRPNPNKIDQHQKVFMIGSCFAEHIAQHLERIGIQTLSNPLGALYNPLSIENSLRRVVEHRKIERDELLCRGDMWFSLDSHGSFDSPDPQEVVESVNNSIAKGYEAFGKADWLVVTLGTARVYERGGNVVANCHKMPAAEFSHRLMTVEEAVEALESVVRMAEGKRVIFTLSPVRYLGSGLEGNVVSKAILRLAIERVVAAHDNADYFPAYEIFLDDLRDYRYYGDDMLHPSKAGVDYVWERFVEYCMTREVEADGELFARLADARNHRPLHPKSEEYANFCYTMFQKARTLAHKFPNNDIAASLVKFFANRG